MNEILVAVDPGYPGVSAAVYAINLAQRMNTKVTFLMMPEKLHDGSTVNNSWNDELQNIKMKLQNIVGQSSGEVRVNYYISHGSFETELISFIRENRINLLVVNSPPPERSKKQQEGRDKFLNRMTRIKQETSCRIIIVSERVNSRAIRGSIAL